ERKRGRVTLGKAVLAKAPNLREHTLGKLLRDAALDHARHELVVVLFDAPGAAPGRHVTPQLIGLAWRVVGGEHRQLHDLLLKNGHAQRFFQDALEARVGKADWLLACSPTQ